MDIQTYLKTHPKTDLVFDLDRTVAEMKIDWSGVHSMLFTTIQTIDPSLLNKPTTNALEYYTAINKVSDLYGVKGKSIVDSTIAAYEYAHYQGYVPNRKLIQFIHTTANTYKLSLWTSNTNTVVQKFLNSEGLGHVFLHVVTLESVMHAKPDPEGFIKIYDHTKKLSNYLMIGDKSTDEFAARNAHIDYFQEEYFNHL